jgi:hypothetical protein
VKLQAILIPIVLAGCATMHIEPANLPMATPASSLIDSGRGLPADEDDLFVGLAFSGGGMRAAAFSYGVLSEFDRTQLGVRKTPSRLIDHVDFVSGVSGGAVTAAYFGLNGRAALADFHERFLMRDADESLSTIPTPMSVARAYEGGMNDAQHFPRWLDDNLFHGATFRELGPEHRPRVWINASDIYNRTPFIFGEFNWSVQHQSQSIGRGFEAQGLARALIEPQSDRVEVGLGEAREIGCSREVLSQQAVGVLVAAALPGTAWIAEVNLHVGGNREALVAGHLLALVPRQGASQLLG